MQFASFRLRDHELIRWYVRRSREKYYIVFELAAGGELYDHLIEEGRFSEAEAKEVAYALVVRLPTSPLHLSTSY